MASAAILLVGLLLVWDSAGTLLRREHVAIERVTLLGRDVWLGYPMLGALFVTGAWPIVVSHYQRKAARAIFDRPVFANALMNKAQWLTSGAAIVGVMLAGFGVWWGDALAGLVISLDIAHDGYSSLRSAASDIMDSAPRTFEKERLDPVVARIANEAGEMRGVGGCEVLARENGRFLFVNLLVAPSGPGLAPALAARLRERVLDMSWRIIYVAVETVDDGYLTQVRQSFRGGGPRESQVRR